MKTWVLGAVLGVPGLVALVACGSSSPSCPAGEMSVTELGVTVCAPAGTGAGTTTSTSTHMTTVTNSASSGSPTTTSTSSGSPATTSSSSGGNGGSGAGGSTSGSCTAPSSAAECGTACTKQLDCLNCVVGLEQTGYDTFNADINNACGCTAGATCASACSSDPICANKGMGMPGMTCQNCLNNIMQGDACIKPGQMACVSDPMCKQFLMDVQPCLQLPM